MCHCFCGLFCPVLCALLLVGLIYCVGFLRFCFLFVLSDFVQSVLCRTASAPVPFVAVLCSYAPVWPWFRQRWG
jgi:hypothetical protein